MKRPKSTKRGAYVRWPVDDIQSLGALIETQAEHFGHGEIGAVEKTARKIQRHSKAMITKTNDESE